MPSARSAPAAKPRQARTPPRARPRRVATRSTLVRLRWDRVGRIGLLVVLVVVAGLYVQHALAYLSTKSQTDAQLTIVNRLTRDNAQLTREQKALNDPATIERDARALGMVRTGERPYVVSGLPNR